MAFSTDSDDRRTLANKEPKDDDDEEDTLNAFETSHARFSGGPRVSGRGTHSQPGRNSSLLSGVRQVPSASLCVFLCDRPGWGSGAPAARPPRFARMATRRPSEAICMRSRVTPILQASRRAFILGSQPAAVSNIWSLGRKTVEKSAWLQKEVCRAHSRRHRSVFARNPSRRQLNLRRSPPFTPPSRLAREGRCR